MDANQRIDGCTGTADSDGPRYCNSGDQYAGSASAVSYADQHGNGDRDADEHADFCRAPHSWRAWLHALRLPRRTGRSSGGAEAG